jgi:hypothetical protein
MLHSYNNYGYDDNNDNQKEKVKHRITILTILLISILCFVDPYTINIFANATKIYSKNIEHTQHTQHTQHIEHIEYVEKYSYQSINDLQQQKEKILNKLYNSKNLSLYNLDKFYKQHKNTIEDYHIELQNSYEKDFELKKDLTLLNIEKQTIEEELILLNSKMNNRYIKLQELLKKRNIFIKDKNEELEQNIKTQKFSDDIQHNNIKNYQY